MADPLEYTTLIGEPYHSESCALLQFDGGAVPNPGKGCGAAVIFSEGNPRKLLIKGGVFLNNATNNQAEYLGLLFGMKRALHLGIRHLLIEGDSQLVIMQVCRTWNVRNEYLLAYHKAVRDLLPAFIYIGIRYIPRAKNAIADALADEGIQKGESFIQKF